MIKLVEVFKSIQGEGAQMGRSVIFVRLAGCNLCCSFCDTDHEQVMGTDVQSVINLIMNMTPLNDAHVVFTGGEPLMQLSGIQDVIFELKRRLSFVEFGVETNGSLLCPSPIFTHISLSPKVHRSECRLDKCSSLKVLYPYITRQGTLITATEYQDFHALHKFIQPVEIDGEIDYQGAIEEVERLGYPWKLGVQLHKLIGVK